MTTWTKEAVVGLLEKNNAAVNRAVLAIYEGQTFDEKSAEYTKYSNGVGFNAFDAKRGTYYAEYIERNGSLTGRHLEVARKMMKKYAGQLSSIANNKAQAIELKAIAATLHNADGYDDANDCQCENYDGESLCPACIKKGKF